MLSNFPTDNYINNSPVFALALKRSKIQIHKTGKPEPGQKLVNKIYPGKLS